MVVYVPNACRSQKGIIFAKEKNLSICKDSLRDVCEPEL